MLTLTRNLLIGHQPGIRFLAIPDLNTGGIFRPVFCLCPVICWYHALCDKDDGCFPGHLLQGFGLYSVKHRDEKYNSRNSGISVLALPGIWDAGCKRGVPPLKRSTARLELF